MKEDTVAYLTIQFELKSCCMTMAEGKAQNNCHTEFESQLSNLFWYKSNGSSKLKNKAGLFSRVDEHKFVQKKTITA